MSGWKLMGWGEGGAHQRREMLRETVTYWYFVNVVPCYEGGSEDRFNSPVGAR